MLKMLLQSAERIFKKYDNEKSGKYEICLLEQMLDKINMSFPRKFIEEIKS